MLNLSSGEMETFVEQRMKVEARLGLVCERKAELEQEVERLEEALNVFDKIIDGMEVNY